jgi:hypothetical protein
MLLINKKMLYEFYGITASGKQVDIDGEHGWE